MYGVFDEWGKMLFHGFDKSECEREKRTLEEVDGYKDLYIDELDEEEERHCD